MKARTISLLCVAALMGAAIMGSPADAKAKKKGPVVMGTDAADDWGSNVDAGLAPAAGPLGQELLEASIEQVDSKTLEFVIKVAELPPTGGMPEFTRYVWTINVDGELIQLDGKFTNYHRGACDPTAGTCPPPRDPGEGPFLVRGNCTDNGGAAVTCEEIGLVNGTFDAAAGTISVPVPIDLLGAKPGSKITHGTQPGSLFAGVWAIPSVWASQGDMPKDELILVKTFVVGK
jgi:hypothetical protein